MYRLKTPQEIENILNAWLDSGAQDQDGNGGDTSRGAAPSDALDNLANEIKATEDDKPKKAAKKAAPVTEDKPMTSSKTALDDAFDDLLND